MIEITEESQAILHDAEVPYFIIMASVDHALKLYILEYGIKADEKADAFWP